MATTQSSTASQIGSEFAALLRSDDAVRGLWASDAGDHIDLWILTEPIPHERELALYELETRLDARHDASNPQVHIVHAGLYDTADFVFEPPQGAEPIPLR